MKWRKLGQIYAAEYVHPKLCSHAANPLPVPLNGDVYRVFFSGRDSDNRSSVGFVDVDILKRKVVYIHDQPVFGHGSDGSFFSHGVSIGNCYETDGKKYMLFMGWQCPPDEHWHGEIGRLVLDDEFSLRLDGEGAFMALSDVDPVSLSYPWVRQETAGVYRMWYGSTLTWDAGNGGMLHVIHHAVSVDGHHWQRCGLAIPYQLGSMQAFSRPSVAGRAGDGYHMWFSYRNDLGQKYRIGYARSETGDEWELKLDETGIAVSTEGWDSEMIEYPFVFDHKGDRYMFYCGNGYGRTGFGLAVLDVW
jgi:hypothetical protein